MKKFGLVGTLVLVVVMSLVLMNFGVVKAADYELTTHPVSSLADFPAADPISGDYIPVLDGSAAEVKKLDATNIFFNTNFFTSGYSGGATTLVSTVTPLTTANLAFGLIQLTHGSIGLHRLPDGVRGKTITMVLLADPAYTLGDDPVTRTGWDTIIFEDVQDRVTLVWIDDTVGWIIVNNDGCRVTQ